MKALLPTVITMALAVLSPPASAADAARGAELATTCMGCHGIEGYRNAYPSFHVPKLGGQKPEYLVAALQEYRAKTRNHATMQAQAATLSDEDLADIAAFVAEEGGLRSDGKPAASAAATRGQARAAVCTACHGARGDSAGPAWPNLAGQQADYLEHALADYKAKERQDPVMQGQAARLTEQDIRDIAAFFAAQPGLFTVHYRQ